MQLLILFFKSCIYNLNSRSKKEIGRRKIKSGSFPFLRFSSALPYDQGPLTTKVFRSLTPVKGQCKYRMFSRLWQGNDYKTFKIYRKKWCYIFLLHQTTTHTYCHTTTSPHHFQRAQSKNVGERHASDKNIPKIGQNSY